MAKPASLENYTEEQVEQMAATYRAIVSNPETRDLALRLTKKVNPDASIPEIELKDAAAAEFKKRDDRNDALEAGILLRDAKDRIRDERTALRDKGYNTDQISAIEKIMTDERIASYATAARYFDGQNAIAEPTPTPGLQSPNYSMPQDPLNAMKSGKKGLNQWALNAATAALADVQAGRVKLH